MENTTLLLDQLIGGLCERLKVLVGRCSCSLSMIRLSFPHAYSQAGKERISEMDV